MTYDVWFETIDRWGGNVWEVDGQEFKTLDKAKTTYRAYKRDGWEYDQLQITYTDDNGSTAVVQI